MRHQLTLGLSAACLLSGCYWEPERTQILVGTAPPGASCVLSQLGHPIATADPTPAIAIVDLVGSPIDVQCRRSGFEDALIALPPAPPRGIPGYVPERRGEIARKARIDIALIPKPPGVPR